MAPASSTSIQTTDEEVAVDYEEHSIIEQAKHDPAAMSILYRQHYSAISKYIYRRVADRHEADDIVSEVFLSMVKSLHRYRWRGVPFRIWLFRLATTQLSRWARKRRHWAMQELKNETTASESKYDSDMETIDLVLATLPLRLQTVLSLHYLEEMKISDIAKIVNRSTGTVKSRLSDGRLLMRKRLEMRGFRNED